TISPDQKLSVYGNASKSSGGSTWENYSDVRLKDIHAHYQHGLKAINKLTPVSFNYKKENPLHLPSDENNIGLKAQEVEQVIPEAVSTNAKGYLMLNNDPIIYAMLNAIKDLDSKYQKKINQQQQVINNLTQEIDYLKKHVNVNSY
ncbi:tail fiber domain-containing protein, partial [Spirochaetota bacterium]